MAQDIYYNDIVAQLVELRNKIGESGGGSGEGGGGTIDTSKLEAKLDEVIKAVKEIKVSTDNISVEAGTINLSTDELEGLLKTVNTNLGIINDNINEFDTNTQTKVAAVIKSIEDNIYTLVTSVNFEGNHNRNNLYNIAKLLGEEIPDDGTEFVPKTTLVKLLTELKAFADYNSDSNFKSSQALTESTAGKGIADITKELTDYLKNIVGLKDEEIGTLYTLINSVDNSLLSIDHEMTPVKNLIASGNSSLQQIKNSLGNTVAPADGSVNKLLTEIKTILSNINVANVDIIKDYVALMDTNVRSINNSITDQSNIPNNLYGLINAISTNVSFTRDNTKATYDILRLIEPLFRNTDNTDNIYNLTKSFNDYLQDTLGIKPDGYDTVWDLVDMITDGVNNTNRKLSPLMLTPASFSRFTMQDALTYIITAIGKGGTPDDPQNVDNTIIGKLKELSSIKSSLIDNADGTVVDYTSSIDVNTANIDVSLGKKNDASAGGIGSIQSKLRYLIEALEGALLAEDNTSIVNIVKKALIADDDTLLVDKVSQIISNLQVNNSSIGAPTDNSNPDGSIHAKLRSLLLFIGPGDIQYIGGGQNPNSIIGSMAIVLNELGALMKKHHEEIKEAIQFQNSILNDNFNPPLHDYTIRIVSNLKLDPTTEFRLTNTSTTSNSPQNIYKDYISLPINKTLYLNYTDFASTYHAYFYVDGQNTKIPGTIKILNEDKKDMTNGGGSYQQGIAPKGSGDTLQTKSIYIILT